MNQPQQSLPFTASLPIELSIEQKFDSLVPYITEVTHPQKRSKHPKVLTFTTDHKQMWVYLRSQQDEITSSVMFDLICAARNLSMTQKRAITVIGDLENAGWIICRDIGNPGAGTYQVTVQDIETIVTVCCKITHAPPTVLSMEMLTSSRQIH